MNKTIHPYRLLSVFALLCTLLPANALLAASRGSRTSGKPNILFIAVDDLRPQLGCYGHSQMISPHIDQLSTEGTLFTRTYCQVPVCGASRASLMTGMRPTRTRFLGYDTWAEKDLPGALSIAQHFKNHGYYTVSYGKIFHHDKDLADGWSEKPGRPKSAGGSWHDYLLPESIAAREQKKQNGKWKHPGGPPIEKADVEDSAYGDGKIADKGIADLQRLKGYRQPFFLALGFLKPHLPFNAPQRYWDLYQPEDLDLADNPFAPQGAPKAALHNWGELRAYAGVPAQGPLSDAMIRSMVHGYYACVSYTDAQIGRVLAELDALGLRDNTVVILWGDHGWNLGEHGLWCKHCNFHTSLHAPLIVRAPGFPAGLHCQALTEYVDIFPSLCELAQLPIPDFLHGRSFVPLMREPDLPWKEFIYSRYFKGESVRTERYLYTEWRDKNGQRYARMLYDHQADPDENTNIAEKLEHKALVWQLSQKLAENRQAIGDL